MDLTTVQLVGAAITAAWFTLSCFTVMAGIAVYSYRTNN
jgi:hypothetical protein